MKEPAYTCPLIDEVISYLEDIHASSLTLISLLGDIGMADVELPPAVYDAYKEFNTIINDSYSISGWKSSGYLIDKMEDIRRANSELREWGSHYEKLYEDLDGLEDKAEELESALADSEDRINELENENYSLEQENDRLKEDIDNLNQYIGELIERAVC